MSQIPIIDLFAGPGGLGEGFSAYSNAQISNTFKIVLSIEKDEFAHKTLELRAFFRQFPDKKVPNEYYDYLSGKISRVDLFGMYPGQAKKAKNEAWMAELGSSTTPNCMIDERIQTALGGAKTWILIGGPPCQAYSLIGRSRIRGENKDKYENDNRHFLYREYLRILAVHQPPVFVMENVKGLLSAEVKEQRIFKRILFDLSNPTDSIPEIKQGRDISNISYQLFPIETDQSDLLGNFQPIDFVVHAEKHGIPQARHRIIILGLRSDITIKPEVLPQTNPNNIEDVINDLPKLRSGLSKGLDSNENWRNAIQQILKAKWLNSSQLPSSIKNEIIHVINQINFDLDRGSEYFFADCNPISFSNWYKDPKLNGVCNHHTRAHMIKDLHRYLYASVFAKVNGHSPGLKDFPTELLPDHRNVQEAISGTKFNDRFRVQLKGRPSTTIVSHISKDGHYYIHYDPCQCRSLTVREAARLQTFPDNYFFEGPQTEQYKQVGNAVPPMLAFQIAEIVARIIT